MVSLSNHEPPFDKLRANGGYLSLGDALGLPPQALACVETHPDERRSEQSVHASAGLTMLKRVQPMRSGDKHARDVTRDLQAGLALAA